MRSEKDGGAYTREKAAVVFLGWLGEIRTKRTNGLKKVPKVGIFSLAATCYTSARPEPAGGPASQPATTSFSSSSFSQFDLSIRASSRPFVRLFVRSYLRPSLFVLLNGKTVKKSCDVIPSDWCDSSASSACSERSNTRAVFSPEILKEHSLSAVIRAKGDILL